MLKLLDVLEVAVPVEEVAGKLSLEGDPLWNLPKGLLEKQRWSSSLE